MVKFAYNINKIQHLHIVMQTLQLWLVDAVIMLDLVYCLDKYYIIVDKLHNLVDQTQEQEHILDQTQYK